jgi:hypothetical protein
LFLELMRFVISNTCDHEVCLKCLNNIPTH